MQIFTGIDENDIETKATNCEHRRLLNITLPIRSGAEEGAGAELDR